MVKITVTCEECGKDAIKERGEVTRSQKMGRRMFCSLSCSGIAVNREKRSKEIVVKCPGCGKRVKTTTHNKARKHCSRSCASKASMSKERREAQRRAGKIHKKNLIDPQSTLKRREAWKYELLRTALRDEPHEFEFKLGDFVFDLALKERKILIEFDGPYHRGSLQQERDEQRDKLAEDHGYVVVRREVKAASVILPETLAGLL